MQHLARNSQSQTRGSQQPPGASFSMIRPGLGRREPANPFA